MYGVKITVSVRVSLRVYVIVLFCKSMVLFPIYYTFIIKQFRIGYICIPYRISAQGGVTIHRLNIVFGIGRVQYRIVLDSLIGNLSRRI